MSRKQIFASLTSSKSDASLDGSVQTNEAAQAPKRPSRIRPLLGSPDLVDDGGRSPIGAIGQSLGELTERSRRADEIENMLLSGQTVVELDTGAVEPSFIPDRMPADDEAFRSFVDAIRKEGQQVPILVRPHPELSDKYQVAFGHRRLRAATELGIAVKAIVRPLSDQELVVAQGQENNERQDLSYIEKVRFAQRLEQQFPRDIIMSALSIYKSDLSNMLSVAAKVPGDVIDAIGPAHGIGRRSWIALADSLAADKANIDKARKLASTPGFNAFPSKERFDAVAKALKDTPLTKNDDQLLSHSGDELGRLTQSKQKITLTVDRRASPDFAKFVTNELPRLFEEYLQSSR